MNSQPLVAPSFIRAANETYAPILVVPVPSDGSSSLLAMIARALHVLKAGRNPSKAAIIAFNVLRDTTRIRQAQPSVKSALQVGFRGATAPPHAQLATRAHTKLWRDNSRVFSVTRSVRRGNTTLAAVSRKLVDVPHVPRAVSRLTLERRAATHVRVGDMLQLRVPSHVLHARRASIRQAWGSPAVNSATTRAAQASSTLGAQAVALVGA